jgi:hypothetical protein
MYKGLAAKKELVVVRTIPGCVIGSTSDEMRGNPSPRKSCKDMLLESPYIADERVPAVGLPSDNTGKIRLLVEVNVLEHLE